MSELFRFFGKNIYNSYTCKNADGTAKFEINPLKLIENTETPLPAGLFLPVTGRKFERIR